MKYKTTKKAVMERHVACVSVGYCNLQKLLNYVSPNAYTCGVYGWNADIYDVSGGYAIVTGYRPFGKSASYELCQKYEKLADKINERYLADELNYDGAALEARYLLAELIAEVV